MSLKCYLAIPAEERRHRGMLSGDPESDPVALPGKTAVGGIPFAERALTVSKGSIDLFDVTTLCSPAKDTMHHCQSPCCEGMCE